MGVRMRLMSFTPQQLVDNIYGILNNTSYTVNARRMAMLVQDRPKRAEHDIVFWVEHVIRFGGQHLRSAGQDLSLYQFFMLDILAFVLLVLLSALFIIRATCVYLRNVLLCTRVSKTKVKLN